MDEDDADFIFALQLQEQFNQESNNEFFHPMASNQEANADHVLALQLQEELNKEIKETPSVPELLHTNKNTTIIDTFWELNDPNPDIHGLFLEFNSAYFWNELQRVEVRWSGRMTLCAGLCCYEGRGGICSIRLSLPLLKLRPRKDLVETLLHEMIHAYLFVTHNNKDHDGHGPEFLKHMNRINKLTGAKITVYHSFHDEVNEYRQHWWRCSGPCKHRPPYYGMVKRAMNRAPSANDFWWEEHQRMCGGTYEKIKEPDKNKRKGAETLTGKEKKMKNENMNIRSPNKKMTASHPTPHNRINGSVNKNHPSTYVNKDSPAHIQSLKSSRENSKFIPFSGIGHVLTSSPSQNINVKSEQPTLLSYFDPVKSRFFSSDSSKIRNQTDLHLSPVKKLPESSREPNFSTNNNLILPSERKQIKMADVKTPKFETWLKRTNTGNSPRMMVLPAGKVSTASPLNHIRKIFLTCDDDSRLHNTTLTDMISKQLPTKKEQFGTIDIDLLDSNTSSSSSSDSQNKNSNTVICPICNQKIQTGVINSHLDICLSS